MDVAESRVYHYTLMYYDFFEFCTESVISLMAEGVIAEVRVSTNSEEPVGFKHVSSSDDLLSKGKYMLSKGQELNVIQLYIKNGRGNPKTQGLRSS